MSGPFHPPSITDEVLLENMANYWKKKAQRLQAELHRRAELENGSVWYWQSEGGNNLETITCQIMIKADDLREIIASTNAPHKTQ